MTSYNQYLSRFEASRGGRALGQYTVFNGLLVPRLSRREFEVRQRQLEEQLRERRELRRRDHTLPFAVDCTIRELKAQLLVPEDEPEVHELRRVAA
jgi:hypothetical protein